MYALNSEFRYSSISYQVSKHSTTNIALISIQKPTSFCGDDIILLWLSVCGVYRVKGRTQVLLLDEVGRR